MTGGGWRPGRAELRKSGSPGRRAVKRQYTVGYHAPRGLSRYRLALALLCAALVLYGGVRLTSYAVWSAGARKTQAELQALYQASAESPTEVPGAQPVSAPAEAPADPPSAVPVLTEAPPEPSPTWTPWYMAQYQRIGSAILPELKEVYRQNRELVGWVDIPGEISQPVVYRNNSYYLTHDFYGQKSIGGTVFLDEASPLSATTQNLLLHGHNMRDGSMFGRLIRYEKRDHWRENCVLRFSTLYDAANYVIFAAMVVDTADVNAPGYVNYAAHATFRTEGEFTAYMAQVQRHSLYPWRVDVRPTDALLTLSTCLEDKHLVVMARRAREGESEAMLAAMVR